MPQQTKAADIKLPVKPGEKLAYAALLDPAVLSVFQSVPPTIIPIASQPGTSAIVMARPFLVLRAFGQDGGQRPIRATGSHVQSGELAFHSESIQIIEVGLTAGPFQEPSVPVDYAIGDGKHRYRLVCEISNLGLAAAYGGIAEFYVSSNSHLDLLAALPTGRIPALGYAGFVLMPGTKKSVVCPNMWTPSTESEAAFSVLVHVYDLLLDPLNRPFDALRDRHVGRRDLIFDFSGTWVTDDPSFLQLTITQGEVDDQLFPNVTIRISAASKPAYGIGSSSVIGRSLQTFTAMDPAMHTPLEQWTLFLDPIDRNVLHFSQTGLNNTIPSSGKLRRAAASFGGNWCGVESPSSSSNFASITLTIEQSGLDVSVSIRGGYLATSVVVSGRVVQGQVFLVYNESLRSGGPRVHRWVLRREGSQLLFSHNVSEGSQGGTSVADFGGSLTACLSVQIQPVAPTTSKEIQLTAVVSDGPSQGVAQLTYKWSQPMGSKSAAILHGDTSTPSVQFDEGSGPYTFDVVVTNSAGQTGTARITVSYQGR
jgi:hypothetical protein